LQESARLTRDKRNFVIRLLSVGSRPTDFGNGPQGVKSRTKHSRTEQLFCIAEDYE